MPALMSLTQKVTLFKHIPDLTHWQLDGLTPDPL